jgi:hypothetical protein
MKGQRCLMAADLLIYLLCERALLCGRALVVRGWGRDRCGRGCLMVQVKVKIVMVGRAQGMGMMPDYTNHEALKRSCCPARRNYHP